MPSQTVFVTRKFPPSVGGMETAAASLWSVLSAVNPDARLIKLSHGKTHLVWWLPWAWLRLRLQLRTGRVRVVIAGDALVHAFMRSAIRPGGPPMVVMVHGLDITYRNAMYRRWALPSLRKAPRVLTNSRATAALAINEGVQPERIRTIRLAVDAPDYAPAKRTKMRESLCQALDLSSDSFLLVTVGRLIERKGVRWFVQQALPRLPATVHYAIAGSGPEAQGIRDAAAAAGVADRVHLFGQVSDSERESLLLGADVFIQPNIPVPDDIEGFGLVAVEAALRGTPVLAADLEGLREAVTNGETGSLLRPGDVDEWVAAVRQLMADPVELSSLGERAAEQARVLYNKATLEADLARALDL